MKCEWPAPIKMGAHTVTFGHTYCALWIKAKREEGIGRTE